MTTTIHGIDMLPIESSQIDAIGHDAATNTPAIQFKGRNGPGSVYHYQNVDAAAFEQFAAAESIGSHFYKHIKPFADKFPYQKMEAAPALQEQVVEAPQEPEEPEALPA